MDNVKLAVYFLNRINNFLTLFYNNISLIFYLFCKFNGSLFLNFNP